MIASVTFAALLTAALGVNTNLGLAYVHTATHSATLDATALTDYADAVVTAAEGQTSPKTALPAMAVANKLLSYRVEEATNMVRWYVYAATNAMAVNTAITEALGEDTVVGGTTYTAASVTVAAVSLHSVITLTPTSGADTDKTTYFNSYGSALTTAHTTQYTEYVFEAVPPGTTPRVMYVSIFDSGNDAAIQTTAVDSATLMQGSITSTYTMIGTSGALNADPGKPTATAALTAATDLGVKHVVTATYTAHTFTATTIGDLATEIVAVAKAVHGLPADAETDTNDHLKVYSFEADKQVRFLILGTTANAGVVKTAIDAAVAQTMFVGANWYAGVTPATVDVHSVITGTLPAGTGATERGNYVTALTTAVGEAATAGPYVAGKDFFFDSNTADPAEMFISVIDGTNDAAVQTAMADKADNEYASLTATVAITGTGAPVPVPVPEAAPVPVPDTAPVPVPVPVPVPGAEAPVPSPETVALSPALAEQFPPNLELTPAQISSIPPSFDVSSLTDAQKASLQAASTAAEWLAIVNPPVPAAVPTGSFEFVPFAGLPPGFNITDLTPAQVVALGQATSVPAMLAIIEGESDDGSGSVVIVIIILLLLLSSSAAGAGVAYWYTQIRPKQKTGPDGAENL